MVIRSGKSKERQYNGQMKKGKRANYNNFLKTFFFIGCIVSVSLFNPTLGGFLKIIVQIIVQNYIILTSLEL
jgi:hypothetical protein